MTELESTVSYVVIYLMFLIIFSTLFIPLGYLLYTHASEAEALCKNSVDRLKTKLSLRILNVSGDVVYVEVVNNGSETVYLNYLRGFRKGSIAVSYMYSGRHVSELVEDYNITEVGVVNTGEEFDPNIHRWISPGEYAVLRITLSNSPDSDTVVRVVFSYMNGVYTSDEERT